jgi:1-acyl-sn-glycerol-3-phosphate acyltransferase
VTFYRLVRKTFRLLAAPMFDLRVEGAEQLPTAGPGILVAPHRSWLDPACLAAACPRPVRFLVMRSVYERRGLSWFYRRLGSIPVSTAPGDAVGALRQALRVLRAGEIVGVFPEGRVFPPGELGPLQPGAALLAVRSAVPLLPAVIEGSASAWPQDRRWPRAAPVRVRFGQPLLASAAGGRRAIEELQLEIEVALRALLQGTELQ